MNVFSSTPRSAGIIFDIGSSSVGAGLVVFVPGKEPQLLYNTRVPMAFQHDLNFKKFFDTMMVSLKAACEDIQRNGIAKFGAALPSKVEDIYCIFSSPWYVSQTKILHYNAPSPIVVTKKIIDDLVAQFSEQFKNSAVAKHALQIHDAPELIEKRIIQIRLNGYETALPYGKVAEEVEVSLFTSIISKEVRSAIAELLHATFNSKHIEMHSFSLSAFSAIRDIVGSEHDFLFFDVGGEVSDVSLIRKGILLETISVPFGRNVLVRHAGEILGTSPEEALSCFILSITGAGGNQCGPRLAEAMAAGEREWVAHITNVLNLFAEAHPIPSTIFLTAHDGSGPIFERFLQNDDLRRFTLANEPFKILVLNPENLATFCRFNAALTRDPFIALEAAFFNKLHSHTPTL